ncbi:MAG TPA: hypothetical protein VGO07_05495, partial [Candidatus Saccharimonadales bacterium]|nr:hypothetical protein [Candidatus Saccharimonadales bacterium]
MARRTTDKSPPSKGFQALLGSARFRPGYALFGVAVLATTTLFWAIAGARLQAGNADQLVNPLLLAHGNTFHQTQFPAAHSQLLKWPVFWLVKLFGLSS